MMLGISELDDMVIGYLDRNDFVACTQVCSTWHRMEISYIWDDLTPIDHPTTTVAFRKMLIYDFVRTRQQKQGQEQQQQSSATSPSTSLLVSLGLAKYGALVRKLPDPSKLRSRMSCPQTLDDQAPAAHLLDFESNELVEIIADLRAPHARVLIVAILPFGCSVETWKLKLLLSRCTASLHTLLLSVELCCTDKRDEIEPAEETDVLPQLQVQSLHLERLKFQEDAMEFWPWLWRQCGHVQSLHLCEIDPPILKSLAEHMRPMMPGLGGLCLGRNEVSQKDSKDGDSVELLNGSVKGWRWLDFGRSVKLGAKSIKVISSLLPTVKGLFVAGSDCWLDYINPFKECPNLAVYCITDVMSRSRDVPGQVAVLGFIDQEPSDGTFKTWACESTFKTLTIKITGVPRPDIKKKHNIADEQYPGQEEFQSLVYDRLARFTQLESLSLGQGRLIFVDGHVEQRPVQTDCLELSLESRLGKLGGLKGMQMLNVSNMAHRIGLRDVQWMVDSWPKLLALEGLNVNAKEGHEFEAVKWLKENHPLISVF
ncbi:hypothetical protein BGX23_008790 [Mortierella sp. AD031]|nr:hypothetical protein BGX23_008790 [Mortierella sp. AD031]